MKIHWGLISAVILGTLGAQALAAPDCSLKAGSLPNPKAAAGTRDTSNPIQHIIVIMQENHSFDNYFGALNDPRFYGKEVDGVQPQAGNLDGAGRVVHPQPETDACVADPRHGWDSVHRDWNGGKLDGFVKENDQSGDGARVMNYYTDRDLPFYYGIANQFAIGDRYFCSTLSQTFPNRFFLMTGTAFGHVKNDMPASKDQFDQRTIYDDLTENGVSWKYYSDSVGYVRLFQKTYLKNLNKMGKIADYQRDLAQGTLPEVVFMDSSYDGQDEHPDADVQVGQAWVAGRIRELMGSSAWKNSVLFLTYDENGGFYDHVAPPEACAPDSIAPMLSPKNEPGDYAHYGFRVPFVALSPYAKHHFVSHRVYDHTSILKYIETKFNLPALTMRDANADPFSDVFDYSHPVMDVQALPSGEPDPARMCNQARAVPPPSTAFFRAAVNGLCLDLRAGETGPVFANCDAQASSQKFQIGENAFHTSQIKSAATSACLAVDWSNQRVVAASCAQDEDQGFDIGESGRHGTYQISAWHGDFCFASGKAGEALKVSTCTEDGSTDFALR